MRAAGAGVGAGGRGGAGGVPLARFELLHTRDVDRARHVVGEAFCPHRLIPVRGGPAPFETRFHAARTAHLNLCFLDYGGRVDITPEPQQDFYLVLIPLAGRAELSHGRELARYDRGGAAVPPVDRGYLIRVDGASPHLVVRVSRSRLEEHLRAMLARPVTEPVRFALRMDLAAPGIRSWRRVVDLLLDEIDGDGAIPAQPLAMRELERLFLGQLLLGQPNNYSALLHGRPRNAAPKAIRRAAALIEEHAAEPLTVEDVAEAAGLSVRTLQAGFRRFLDTTPTRYLREARLRRVHEVLAAADPTRTTVTETALAWGFLHAGRFSAQYRDRFGEAPSETLRH